MEEPSHRLRAFGDPGGLPGVPLPAKLQPSSWPGGGGVPRRLNPGGLGTLTAWGSPPFSGSPAWSPSCHRVGGGRTRGAGWARRPPGASGAGRIAGSSKSRKRRQNRRERRGQSRSPSGHCPVPVTSRRGGPAPSGPTAAAPPGARGSATATSGTGGALAQSGVAQSPGTEAA